MKLISRIVGGLLSWALCFCVYAEEKASLSPYELLSPEDRPTSPPYDELISDAEALDIAEVTFRYQFQRYQLQMKQMGAKHKIGAYFLSLFPKDPSPDFLKRFKEHKPIIRKGTAFRPEFLKRYKNGIDIFEKSVFQREIGIWFRISGMRRYNNEAEVHGRIYGCPGPRGRLQIHQQAASQPLAFCIRSRL